jgi:hypothetical protein
VAQSPSFPSQISDVGNIRVCINQYEGPTTYQMLGRLWLKDRILASGEVTEHVRDGTRYMEIGSVGTTVNVFNLPIGVKQSRQLKDYPNSPSTKQQS